MLNAEVYCDGVTHESNGGGSPSIAWTCFDRALGSADKEFDEGIIRAVTGTMYLGEEFCGSYEIQILELLSTTSWGGDCEGNSYICLAEP